jgi:hypothetical protein
MCAKRERWWPELLALREEALQEWAVAESLSDLLRAWARLGGRTTLHRYGRSDPARSGRIGGSRLTLLAAR